MRRKLGSGGDERLRMGEDEMMKELVNGGGGGASSGVRTMTC